MKKKLFTYINNLSKKSKISIIILFDLSLIFLTFTFSYFLYLNTIFEINIKNIFYIFLVSSVSIPIFSYFGLYKSLIQYIEFESVLDILKAVTIFLLVISLIVFFFNFVNLSKRVILINYAIILISIIYSRLIAKKLIYGYLGKDKDVYNKFEKNILIFGANNLGILILNDITKEQNINLLGFIDQNSSKIGRYINKHYIYDLENLKNYFLNDDIDQIIVPENTDYEIINKLYEFSSDREAKVLIAPEVNNIINANLSINQLKELSIEDIISRKVIKPLEGLLNKNIHNQTVLISGAGGSIGSEISSIIAKLNPKHIILLDNSEYNLYKIYNNLITNQKLDKNFITPILCGVDDKKNLRSVFEKFKVDVFFHAAAYKHVDLVEQNILFSLKNNIIGAINSIVLSIENNVKNFVLISSDKAVRPTNFMGASKRFAELVIKYHSSFYKKSHNTNFCAVRFGNVIGSSGSVIPLFEKQLKNGGPLTVTDKKIKRYFMTINEAAELVIQASALSKSGDIFVLDMGEPILIDEIAKKMINLKGYKLVSHKKLDNEIEINYTGLRPGEKLYEELHINNNSTKTIHPKISKSEEKTEFEHKSFNEVIQKFIVDLEKNDKESIIQILNQYVENFNK